MEINVLIMQNETFIVTHMGKLTNDSVYMNSLLSNNPESRKFSKTLVNDYVWFLLWDSSSPSSPGCLNFYLILDVSDMWYPLR